MRRIVIMLIILILIIFAIPIIFTKANKVKGEEIIEEENKIEEITLKDYNDAVEKTLKGQFDVVVYWKDISLDYWINEMRLER